MIAFHGNESVETYTDLHATSMLNSMYLTEFIMMMSQVLLC